MHRLLTHLLIIAVGLCAIPTFAANTELTDSLNQIQQSIDKDVKYLANAKGEIKSFTEYRIKHNAALLQSKLKEQFETPEPDIEYLRPYVASQLRFIHKVEVYFAEQTQQLTQQLGGDNDSKFMMALSRIERERDALYVSELQILKWAAIVGIDVKQQTAAFTASLNERADTLNSLVQYTQARLNIAVEEVKVAGADVSAAQTAQVSEMKERLSQSSSSLSTAIELLDALGQDSAYFKQTLFSVSGDITQDVLNLDVAGSLLGEWLNVAKTQAMENGPSIVFKLIVFSLILFLSSLVGKLTKRIVQKTVSNSKLRFSVLLQEFFISLSGKTVFSLGLLIALSQLGFELAPLLAGFGIAGVIIGFALQDTLSNFASGMMILVYRPYDVGDLINAAGVTGKVAHMSLVSTTIKTLDNQRLIIPNNKIWGDTINNITVEHQRRVDMTFGIGYSDDIEHAEKVLNDIINAHPKVLSTPEPMVKLHTLGESSVDFVVRPWVQPVDYWDVYWDVTRSVKMRFDAEGISIPFPQRDVHIYQAT